MQQAAIQQWLKRKAATEAATGILFATGCLLLGGIVLLITFFFTYAVVWFGFNMGVRGFTDLFFGKRLNLSHAGVVGVSLAFVALLFWANQRISREYLGTLPRRNYPGSGLGRLGLPGVLICLLAYPGASARLITDLLLTGPRLVAIAWSNVRKSIRLFELDVEGCSRTLAILLRKNGRVSFADLAAAAELRAPQSVFLHLRDISGVVFLRAEPSGLSLTSELRKELFGALGEPIEQEPVAAPAPTARHVTVPPGTIFELLGVPSTASPEEIEVAYRNWMTQSCARQVAELEDAARKQQLDEQVKAVNTAYEAFLAAHKSDQVEDDTARVQNVWEQFKRSGKRPSIRAANRHEQS